MLNRTRIVFNIFKKVPEKPCCLTKCSGIFYLKSSKYLRLGLLPKKYSCLENILYQTANILQFCPLLRSETRFFSSHTSKEKNEDESILPSKVFHEARKLKVEQLKQNADTHPYPHKFATTTTLSTFAKKYDCLKTGDRLEDVSEQVAGRILSIRRASSKLYFFDVQGDGTKIQVKVDLSTYDNKDHFADEMSKFHRGDIVGVHGSPCRTQSGELSIDSKMVT